MGEKTEIVKEEYHTLTQSGGRIGPEGGRLEVLPDTWVTIEPDTFDQPTFVAVQVSHLKQIAHLPS